MKTATRRFATVLLGAPLALGLLSGTASAHSGAGASVTALPAAAPVIAAPAQAAPVLTQDTQDPMGPPTGMDPTTPPIGPAMPEVTTPGAAGPAAALPRTGSVETALLGVAGFLLVMAGVLMHVAARPVPSVNPRFVVRLA